LNEAYYRTSTSTIVISATPNNSVSLGVFGVASAGCQEEMDNNPVPSEDASALYLENGFQIDEGFIEGQRWYGLDSDSVRLGCFSAPWVLRFVFSLPSEEEFVLSLEALDGEALETGVFAADGGSFRINFLEWDDSGRLLVLDVDFEAEFFGEDLVAGRLIWNSTWSTEDPPYLGLTDEDYEVAYPGRSQISTNLVSGKLRLFVPAANEGNQLFTITEHDEFGDPVFIYGQGDLSVLGASGDGALNFTGYSGGELFFTNTFDERGLSFITLERMGGPDSGGSIRLVGFDPETGESLVAFGFGSQDPGPTDELPTDEPIPGPRSPAQTPPGVRDSRPVDTIIYAGTPAQAAADARVAIEDEVAQLYQVQLLREAIAKRKKRVRKTHVSDPQSLPDEGETSLVKVAPVPSVPRASDTVAVEWNPAAPRPPTLDQALSAEPKEPIRVELYERNHFDDSESEGEVVPEILSQPQPSDALRAAQPLGAVGITPDENLDDNENSQSEVPVATAAPPIPLEDRVRGWVATIADWLEGAKAYWTEVSL
jgi:hypothetical protein